MPTIIRFLTTLAVLAAVVAAAMYYLGNFVEPRSRPMSVRIPADRLEPVPILDPAPPAEEDPAAAEGPAEE